MTHYQTEFYLHKTSPPHALKVIFRSILLISLLILQRSQPEICRPIPRPSQNVTRMSSYRIFNLLNWLLLLLIKKKGDFFMQTVFKVLFLPKLLCYREHAGKQSKFLKSLHTLNRFCSCYHSYGIACVVTLKDDFFQLASYICRKLLHHSLQKK